MTLFEHFYGCPLETVVGACLGVEGDVRAAAEAMGVADEGNRPTPPAETANPGSGPVVDPASTPPSRSPG